ncbi:flagellar brake protein [Acidaminobacter sp. JC074]|uniref:flagellar brake protein n=1 Tax=Acidaminobacter sp. JC074 TaxID=2530199 RepID=UPI001F0D1E59|nr:PilZ domain-containing protein [Acidaminobacter sp. JC074]MCH4887198.1 flagellar brake protein [Acidaminobacter sp. JC074]
MNNNWFKPKQRIELHIDTSKGILNLATHMEHITDAGEFIVAAPFYKGHLYPFLSKEHVELFTIVEGTGIISCDVVVDRRLKNGDVVLLLLERISDIRKTQRRKHYRLPTLLEAEVITPERPNLSKIHAVSRDISAGGIRMVTPEQLFQKEHVRLRVDLNGQELSLHSNVLESIEMNTNSLRYDTRLQFSELNSNEERVIVAYIFDEQRKRRRRG